MTTANLVDLVVLFIFALYVSSEYQRGFLRLFGELVGLVIAFIIGIRFYLLAASLMQNWFGLSPIFAKPIAFLTIWILIQALFMYLGKILSLNVPVWIRESKLNIYAGIIPAVAKGSLLVAVLMILFVIMPINTKIKKNIEASLVGQTIMPTVLKAEGLMESVFGGGNATSLTFTSETGTDEERVPLNFTTTDMTLDEASEKKMLELVNEDRRKANLKPVKANILVRNVARAHSRDMFIRGYFSHNSTDGKNLFTRLVLANVSFQEAAENLALAPTVELAHTGLMNSEKHRKNILDPDLTEVGIGIADGGIYGLMVTQDFIK